MNHDIQGFCLTIENKGDMLILIFVSTDFVKRKIME